MSEVESVASCCYSERVSKLAKAIAVLTLVLWAMAAMHCKLEGVPGFAFLQSCCFLPADAQPTQPCDTDSCGTVEDGNYRAEEPMVNAPTPALTLVFLLASPAAEVSSVKLAGSASPDPPPELRAWQFVQRAAHPPRAPSLFS